jgi:S1-C subfamily serine protease
MLRLFAALVAAFLLSGEVIGQELFRADKPAGEAVRADKIDGVAVKPFTTGDLNALINATNFIVGYGCSGTLVSSKERLIVTNHHCITDFLKTKTRENIAPNGEIKEDKKVQERKDVPVKQTRYDEFTPLGEKMYLAQIVGYDTERDVALLQIRDKTFHSNTIAEFRPEADGSLQRGDELFIVGNPAGFEASLTKGIVSAVNRTLDWGTYETRYVQFDGGITGGNSGGAAYDRNGKYVGIPGAMLRDAKHIGFIVPLSEIKVVMKKYCFASLYAGKDADKGCVRTAPTAPATSSGPHGR